MKEKKNIRKACTNVRMARSARINFFINSASGLTNFIAAGVGNYQRHVNHRRVDLQCRTDKHWFGPKRSGSGS